MQLIYCDESCHLEKDNINVMVLGAMSCGYENKKKVIEDIRNIKIKHNLSKYFEIKWTKVSESKVEFYLELVDYFINSEFLNFRGVVVKNKKGLNHIKYESCHDEWYYKMYYTLLNFLLPKPNYFSYNKKYKVFLDVKDTISGYRVKDLHDYLCHKIDDCNKKILIDIQQIRSSDSEILQISDLFIGAIGYWYRDEKYNEFSSQEKMNPAKKKLIETITKTYNLKLDTNSPYLNYKFNLFCWDPFWNESRGV
jgi:hypothetical protein